MLLALAVAVSVRCASSMVAVPALPAEAGSKLATAMPPVFSPFHLPVARAIGVLPVLRTGSTVNVAVAFAEEDGHAFSAAIGDGEIREAVVIEIC